MVHPAMIDRLGVHGLVRAGLRILLRRRGIRGGGLRLRGDLRHRHAVHAMVLRGGGRTRRQDHAGNEERGEPDHAAPPFGRTLTVRIIPAIMWYSRWQWNAQSPTASAVKSQVTLPPGCTITVCLRGA